ncbi:MAG TPA: RNA methyltransferase [Verrucomicrobiae bacterium]|jgi:tRNA G18 (ribose-2'-O)-methylase SpoU
MFSVEPISSFDRPELQPYATLRRSAAHEEQGIFVAESEKVVRRLLESELTIVSAVLSERWLEEFRPLLEARRENIIVYLAETDLLEKLVGFHMFQGILAVAKIPPPIPLDELLARLSSPKLLVAVDEVANAENLGALVRNCVAFNAQALLVGETSSSPYLRRAVRNSMGTIFQLPVVEIGGTKTSSGHKSYFKNAKSGLDGVSPHQNSTLVQTLRDLRARGIRGIAAHPHTDKKTLSQTDFTGDCCIVFGSEGNGISRAVLESCDEVVAIPMPPAVDSLNVGAAAAVFLYEVARQRGKG